MTAPPMQTCRCPCCLILLMHLVIVIFISKAKCWNHLQMFLNVVLMLFCLITHCLYSSPRPSWVFFLQQGIVFCYCFFVCFIMLLYLFPFVCKWFIVSYLQRFPDKMNFSYLTISGLLYVAIVTAVSRNKLRLLVKWI